MLARLGIRLGLLTGARASSVRIRLRQFHSGAPRLGKSDRNRLLGRSRAMLSLAHMMNLFAHKFARLDGRCLTLGLVFVRSSKRFLFWHLPHRRDEFSKEIGQHSCHRARSDDLSQREEGAISSIVGTRSAKILRTKKLLALQRGRREMARDFLEVGDELPHLDVSRSSSRARKIDEG